MPPQNELKKIRADTKQQIAGSLLQLYRLGKVRSDPECAERIQMYFQLCADSSVVPGIESLACALGVHRSTVYEWSRGGRGASKERQEMIASAKSMISAFTEQAVMRGQINPASGIFLMKNWFNYHDAKSFEVEQVNDGTKPQLTLEEIRARLRKDIPED